MLLLQLRRTTRSSSTRILRTMRNIHNIPVRHRLLGRYTIRLTRPRMATTMQTIRYLRRITHRHQAGRGRISHMAVMGRIVGMRDMDKDKDKVDMGTDMMTPGDFPVGVAREVIRLLLRLLLQVPTHTRIRLIRNIRHPLLGHHHPRLPGIPIHIRTASPVRSR